MSIILDFLMILFLLFITISIIGLLWSLVRNKPARKWMIRLIINLILFVTITAVENNYLSSLKNKENTMRYQEKQQAAGFQYGNNYQNLLKQELNLLEQNIIADKSKQYIDAVDSNIKMQIGILKAKIDYLKKYISNYAK